MNYRQLREQKAAELEAKRKDLFSVKNQNTFAERQRQRQKDELRLEARKTTDSLASLVSKMSDQVQRSENTTTTLIHSSDVLQTTHGQYHTIGSTIKTGSKLISKYGRREFTDRLLICLALLVYFGVVVYILRKRVPLMSYFVWLPFW